MPVGYGRVGKRIAQALTAQGLPFVVAEQNREFVAAPRAQVGKVFMAEHELAQGMTGHVLARVDRSA
jgi:voltage-gated potassium channel Kch